MENRTKRGKRVTELFDYKDKPTRNTPCCYNCKHLDDNDHEKQLAILKYPCVLLKQYKYKYSRCNEHTEAIKGTVRLNEQKIYLNPKGGVKD
jgi:hypothetical protein